MILVVIKKYINAASYKKIIIMTIVNVIFFYSFQSAADEMVLIKNTGLGLREISKEGH